MKGFFSEYFPEYQILSSKNIIQKNLLDRQMSEIKTFQDQDITKPFTSGESIIHLQEKDF